MFILAAILLTSGGVLLLMHAKRISEYVGVNLLAGALGIVLILVGAMLVYQVLTGQIVFPLQ